MNKNVLRLLTRAAIAVFVAPIFLSSVTSYAATKTKSVESKQTVKILPGDTIFSLLNKYGFNEEQRKAALSQAPVSKDYVLSPGDTFQLLRNKKAKSTELRFYAKKKPILYKYKLDNDKVVAKAEKIKFTVKNQKAEGRVRGSLVESINAVIDDELLAYRFMDAFVLDYNLPKVLQKNAAFSLTFQKLFHEGEFIRNGEILRAEVEIDNQMQVRKFEWLSRGGVFVNAAKNPKSRPFYSPVDYVRITSLYQKRRFHPIKKYRKAHQGIDFELPEGEPIYAIQAGVVHRIGKQRGAGRFVVLRHANGYESFYNHMSKLAALRSGDKVSVGAKLGEIGCSGYCTKPHLHFALAKNGNFIDPIKLIKNFSYHQKDEYNRIIANQD